MQGAKYTVHFGVHRRHVELVLPGVDNLVTAAAPGSWISWEFFGDEDIEEPDVLHITVDTSDPFETVTRVMRHFGSLLVPRKYDYVGYLGWALIRVTSRENWLAPSNFEGCFHVYSGQEEPPDYMQESV